MLRDSRLGDSGLYPRLVFQSGSILRVPFQLWLVRCGSSFVLIRTVILATVTLDFIAVLPAGARRPINERPGEHFFIGAAPGQTFS
jgi:hypothetical protein